ncbi:NUDIX domain-containing protein [Streptomyces sp. NPDC091371]|uniref:NUDIX domain-containing protein n=1 Tax=Streptomyces sp. NPDC091371 TaxID=3155303 RepID=UPI003435ECAD
MTAKWLPPEQYIETVARATSAACLYFTDTRGRPVQLRARRATEIWQWPGGNMDPGETPWECAVRECLEETGIIFEGPRTLLGSQFIRPRGTSWPANHIVFIFDGGTLTDEQIDGIVLDPDEHTEMRVETVEEWEKAMTPVGFARLKGIDEARRTGKVAYFER